MEHALPESIKEEVIEEERAPHSGSSGSELERVHLRDGSRLVLKHITPEGDWGLRVTRDRGRVASLWTTGVLNRVSDVIEYPVVSVELGTASWTFVMRRLIGRGAVDANTGTGRVHMSHLYRSRESETLAPIPE